MAQRNQLFKVFNTCLGSINQFVGNGTFNIIKMSVFVKKYGTV